MQMYIPSVHKVTSHSVLLENNSWVSLTNEKTDVKATVLCFSCSLRICTEVGEKSVTEVAVEFEP